MISYTSNGKVMIIYLIIGLIRKRLVYKLSYYPEPYNHNQNEVKSVITFAIMQDCHLVRNNRYVRNCQEFEKFCQTVRKMPAKFMNFY